MRLKDTTSRGFPSGVVCWKRWKDWPCRDLLICPEKHEEIGGWKQNLIRLVLCHCVCCASRIKRLASRLVHRKRNNAFKYSRRQNLFFLWKSDIVKTRVLEDVRYQRVCRSWERCHLRRNGKTYQSHPFSESLLQTKQRNTAYAKMYWGAKAASSEKMAWSLKAAAKDSSSSSAKIVYSVVFPCYTCIEFMEWDSQISKGFVRKYRSA